MSNSIASHLFQSIFQIYFNFYEFQQSQFSKTNEKHLSFASNMHQQQNFFRDNFYESQNARVHAFNNRKKSSLFADDLHQKRHNSFDIMTYDYEKRRFRSFHREQNHDRYRSQSRIKSTEIQMFIKSIEFKSSNVDYFFSNMSDDQNFDDVIVSNKKI